MNREERAIRILPAEAAQGTVLKRSGLRMDQAGSASLQASRRPGSTPESVVEQILESIRSEGESAARRWSLALDSIDPSPLILGSAALERAWNSIADDLKASLEAAADRIRCFHQLQPISSWYSDELGGRLGQRITPIRRVGVYVPGGGAPLPSSLLMTVIPAQVAGVPELIIATPPNPDPAILAAAHLCGLDQVLQLGGAQGIAALAYGLEGLDRVDKIVGAGGLFVTLAKKAVFGDVGIDGLAGPTETMIIADDPARPEWLAADLLAQAEHDPLASAILLTPNPDLAAAVQSCLEEQLKGLSRRDVIEQSLQNHGAIILVDNIAQAVTLANRFAPEHLCLALEDPKSIAEQLHNAGGLFLGEYSCEVLGDYMAGPSHVMPTNATARFANPLSVLDFVKITSWLELDQAQATALAGPAAHIAEAEGLTAHCAAARLRMEAADD